MEMLTKYLKFLDNYKYTLLTVLTVLGCIFYYIIDPSKYNVMPKCPIKLLTTLDCPGCGFQRALHAALHGRIIEAVHYNMFLLIAIPITCLWFSFSLFIEYTTNYELKIRLLSINRHLIYTYIMCYSCWFIIRNVIKM